MGRKVNVFLQYWALDAFRAENIQKDHGVAPEAGPEGLEAYQRHGGQHWSEIFRQAKDVGEVNIHACSLSMEMFGLEVADLDPLVEDQEGVASFFSDVDGPVTFI
jgi:peroxiredoxin family protein